ncbi:MAG: amidohydrolase [Myxococcales bacterium]|nr:amidohydrolase [Myxococcales bacterium]
MSGATVLVNARVRSMDSAQRRAHSIGWQAGRVVAVGSRADVLARCGRGARVIDVGGAHVLPGFIDAHHHVSLAALYGGQLRLVPPAVHDIASLQRALVEAARPLSPGRWLVALDWNEAQLAERRPPTRQELDDALPDRPLFALHYTGHSALANSAALEAAGIGRGTRDPAGGKISRGAGGEPDGLLIERGIGAVESLARADLVTHDRESYLARLHEHQHAMLARGITRVCDTTVPADLMALYRESARRGELLVPTIACPVSIRGYFEEPWDALQGPATGERDESGTLVVGPVKLVFDGAPACSMCLGWWQALGALFRASLRALQERSLDPWRTAMSIEPRLAARLQMRSGIAMYQPDEARSIVDGALERGFALATHAVGNAAVDVALDAYSAARARLHGPGPARLEHAAFIDQAQAARIADAGIVVVSQPYFFSLEAYQSAVSIPGLRFFPHRWLLDAGAVVAGSSDYPVAGFDPLEGVRRAITRHSARGETHEPDQRVTLDEALAMYTRGAARACDCDDAHGSLEQGKQADLVLVDGDLERLGDGAEMRVRATVIGGETRYGALSI